MIDKRRACRSRCVLVPTVAVVLATLAASPEASGTGALTDEAITVWQHRDSPGAPTGWDIWYSIIGRPSPGDASSLLAWHAGGGTTAAPIDTIVGDDMNPHIGISAGGTVLAVWQHQQADGSWDIFNSSLAVVGDEPVWSAPEAVALLGGDDYDPAVAVDTNDNALAVWVHRNPDGSREIYYSVRTGAIWGVPAAVGATGGAASLPEVTVTSLASAGGSLAHTAVAAWSDVIAGGDHRMFASNFDGLAWTAPVEIESPATGIGVSIVDVGFANYVAADPIPFGAFGRLGVAADGADNAFIVWGGGPILLGNFSPGIVGAILDVQFGTWTEMLSGGQRFIGIGGCENPDDALTTGGGDFVGVFSFAGFIEHTQRVAGEFTFESFSYDSLQDDQRPSDAAVSATEMIAVNWAAPVGPGSEIIWSVGTVVGDMPGPPSVTWAAGGVPLAGADLVPGGLAGEDAFPEIGSGFAASFFDCNDNGVPDGDDIASGTSPDCNANGVPDECDIADGTSQDTDGNGIPDECEPPPGLADLDIKPGSCPNSFNRNNQGMLPVALVGTPAFDVAQVDLSSLLLIRTDGEGGAVAPYEGPPGPHSVIDDVATPFDGEEQCDCHELNGDGIDDLSLKFRSNDVVSALDLEGLPSGALVSLTLLGQLNDGTPFSADDCVRLVPPGTPPGLLAVDSNLPGVWVMTSPLDDQLDSCGFTAFNLSFPLTTLVTMVVPVVPFQYPGWILHSVWIDGVPTMLDGGGTPLVTLDLEITSDHSVVFVYTTHLGRSLGLGRASDRIVTDRN